MPPHATDCPPGTAGSTPSAPQWEVAAIFRLYGETYRRAHQRVPQRPKGDVRVYGEMRSLTGGASVPLLPVSGLIGGLETLLSPLRLPLPPALAAESLRPL
jgi:hypothetical protein